MHGAWMKMVVVHWVARSYHGMDDGAPLFSGVGPCSLPCEVMLTKIDYCKMNDGAPLCEALDSGVDPCGLPCKVMLTEINLGYSVVGQLAAIKSMLCSQDVHPTHCTATEIINKDKGLLCIVSGSGIDLDTSTILLF